MDDVRYGSVLFSGCFCFDEVASHKTQEVREYGEKKNSCNNSNVEVYF